MARGVGDEAVVPVIENRGANLLVAIISLFKAGGVYLPLDPSYPERRLAYMIEDAGVRVLSVPPAEGSLVRRRPRVLTMVAIS